MAFVVPYLDLTFNWKHFSSLEVVVWLNDLVFGQKAFDIIGLGALQDLAERLPIYRSITFSKFFHTQVNTVNVIGLSTYLYQSLSINIHKHVEVIGSYFEGLRSAH